MNKKVKKKWLTALRSGKYKQGNEALKCGKQYCCLGVLCDIYSKEFDHPWTQNDLFLNQGLVLPAKVMEWAELKDDNPDIVYDEAKMPIAEVNDAGVDFKTIANLIEEQL